AIAQETGHSGAGKCGDDSVGRDLADTIITVVADIHAAVRTYRHAIRYSQLSRICQGAVAGIAGDPRPRDDRGPAQAVHLVHHVLLRVGCVNVALVIHRDVLDV